MPAKLLGMNLEELKALALQAGLPAFSGKQLAQWLYEKKVSTFEEMTNLSKAGREVLASQFETGVTRPLDCQVSSDGTKKYLFPVETPEPGAVEAVMIPDADRKTLCVSSQAGCKMGCRFCMTGRQGFHGNLSVSDILSQFLAVDEAKDLTNAVFMGMGEPLDNYDAVMKAIDVLTAPWGFGWSPKRITLSTIGVLPALKRFLDGSRCHLAVSLHNPFPEERAELMPVQKAYDIRDVVDLFAGWNDTKRHADALARLIKGLECRVNLIRFHRIPDFPYGTSPDGVMERFRDRLAGQGITCTIRASRGEDIFAACGMLAGKHKQN